MPSPKKSRYMKQILTIWSMAVTMATVVGCTPPGTFVSLASSPKSNVTHQTLVLKRQATNFVDVVSEVGESLDYDLAGTDRAKNQVRFTHNTSALTSVFVGKTETVELIVTLNRDGRSIDFELGVVGNLKTASQEKVEKRLSDFKAALLKRWS